MSKAKIINERDIVHDVEHECGVRLIIAVDNKNVIDELMELVKYFDQYMGKPRHVKRVGNTIINSKVTRKRRDDPNKVVVLDIISSKIAKDLFIDEIKHFCEES